MTDDLAQIWRRVILQAIRDALLDRKHQTHQTENLLHKAEAIAWLESDGRDFHTVCQLAGVSAQALRDWWTAYRDKPDRSASVAALIRKKAQDARPK